MHPKFSADLQIASAIATLALGAVTVYGWIDDPAGRAIPTVLAVAGVGALVAGRIWGIAAERALAKASRAPKWALNNQIWVRSLAGAFLVGAVLTNLTVTRIVGGFALTALLAGATIGLVTGARRRYRRPTPSTAVSFGPVAPPNLDRVSDAPPRGNGPERS